MLANIIPSTPISLQLSPFLWHGPPSESECEIPLPFLKGTFHNPTPRNYRRYQTRNVWKLYLHSNMAILKVSILNFGWGGVSYLQILMCPPSSQWSITVGAPARSTGVLGGLQRLLGMHSPYSPTLKNVSRKFGKIIIILKKCPWWEGEEGEFPAMDLHLHNIYDTFLRNMISTYVYYVYQ